MSSAKFNFAATTTLHPEGLKSVRDLFEEMLEGGFIDDVKSWSFAESDFFTEIGEEEKIVEKKEWRN